MPFNAIALLLTSPDSLGRSTNARNGSAAAGQADAKKDRLDVIEKAFGSRCISAVVPGLALALPSCPV